MTYAKFIERNPQISPEQIERSIRKGHLLRSQTFTAILKDIRRHLPLAA